MSAPGPLPPVRRAIRRACPLVIGLAVGGAPALASAQSRADSAPPITLEDVVTRALADNTQIRLARLRVEGARGSLLAVHAPFDLQLSSAVQRNQEQKQMTAVQFTRQDATSYQVALSKQLPSGISVSPRLGVASTRSALAGTQATGSAVAGLDVRVPLLYDRGGAVSFASVRVAEFDLETSEAAWYAALPSGATAAVGAYWSYLASVRRVEVQRGAEARAQRLLDETTELVKREERAPADLHQLRATVASRRAARLLAEQAVEEARVQLGALMGLDGGAVLAVGEPATDFPQPSEARVGDSASLRRLHGLALLRRPDLAAQRMGQRASDLRLGQLERALQPRLDLDLSLGYQGFAQGSVYDHLVSPLYRNVPGLNATVQLRYSGAMTNSAARGRLAEEGAVAQQRLVALRDLERQVHTDVHVAAQGVDRSAVALRDAEEAVALYRVSVENEQRKLRLGMNTLFDVLGSEDALTNALLAAINHRRVHATALASLRLATGGLAELGDGEGRVDATRFLRLP